MASLWIFVGCFHPKVSHASTSSEQTPRSAKVDAQCAVTCASPDPAIIAAAFTSLPNAELRNWNRVARPLRLPVPSEATDT